MIYDRRCAVYLRRLEEDDSSTIIRWRNDVRIRRWCRQKDLIHTLNHVMWYTKQANDPAISMYGICTHCNTLVGVAGLTSIDHHNQHAEFSLYICPDQHKRGYGKEALRLLFLHGFDTLNLKTIWGETFYNNPAQLMFEAIGMKKEGVLRNRYFKDGKHWDSIMYSITKEELGEL